MSCSKSIQSLENCPLHFIADPDDQNYYNIVHWWQKSSNQRSLLFKILHWDLALIIHHFIKAFQYWNKKEQVQSFKYNVDLCVTYLDLDVLVASSV